MSETDQRVDAYIARAAPFAQPVLRELRARVHEACPGARETIKWGMPFFEYRGPLAGMAAFKAHCAFTLWKGKLLVAEAGVRDGAMGQFGRLESVSDLPGRSEMRALLRKAATLNEAGVRMPTRRTGVKKAAPSIPGDLRAALEKNAAAKAAFTAFSPSHRREYIEWIVDAKRAETRGRRLQQAVQWIAEGKGRNWKYEKKEPT